jgi:asparagine synthase (glutamine-hydrolysing)
LGDLTIWYIGSEKAVRDFERLLPVEGELDKRAFSGGLSKIVGNFAAIVEGQRWIMAVVDKIRSYPVFYMEREGSFCVSNSARLLKEKLSLCEVDDISLLEFRMAGYVTGKETLYKYLYQLQAGELLLWDKTNRVLERERYYLFYSEKTRRESEDELIDELDQITNRIFHRIIEEVNGAPIWIPLSGGLDSRLVLCKLKEIGYDNLHAFSYGPLFNFEAKAAKYVANTLEVPWIFVPSTRERSRKFFYSKTRSEYWSFSDGLCSVPFMQDLDTLLLLRRSGKLADDAIIVNGQSGDFITGGHIPEIITKEDVTIKQFMQVIIENHFSLWTHLKTVKNQEKIENKILNQIPVLDENIMANYAAYYELWEWQERQCKYVINGQRIYDFLNLSWRLPLWDSDYLYFWEKIETEHKLGQSLYKKYLRAYNYKKLFKGFSPIVWRWPGIILGIVPIARLVGVIFGKKWKDSIYKYASYWGHYSNHFAGYGLKYFFEYIGKARNVISFSVARWIKENDMTWDLEGEVCLESKDETCIKILD